MFKAPVVAALCATLAIVACLPAQAQSSNDMGMTGLSNWSTNVATQRPDYPGGHANPADPGTRSAYPVDRATRSGEDYVRPQPPYPSSAEARIDTSPPAPTPRPLRGEAAERRMTECLNEAMARHQPLGACRR